MVTVTIGGQSIEIEPEVWRVLMQAINRLVDSGDIALLDDSITRGLLARARMASGALYLIANPPATDPSASRAALQR